MSGMERFWQASLEELKRGYVHEEGHSVCLLCGERFEKGMIYPHEGRFYEVERYMQLHIEEVHQSVFAYLISLDKKMTGLTEHQNKLLQLFYQGKSDADIQKEMEIGSASTIRNHRFTLKEKERQAKVFLTLMELLKDKDQHAPAFVAVPPTAAMLDDRYNVTEEEKEAVLNKYFQDGSLQTFSLKEKQKLIVLREIAKQFQPGNYYSEKEVNERLQAIYGDYVLLRRYLIEYGFLDRRADGSEYWLKK
ncbi:transcriptional regulator [Bacillus sp. FJAT-27231]|uniref:DUF2087 domain-containing protein n=1 Tax=Bacillus sp. FJAT-27231 TaxID=1679168 RepID=UPI000671803E|nr:DUF2087 domain-containing protein [Bacillus sp. FJAT-27231]KMY55365.1 transcriptional regulator [Bacillus sp. FJAT-27231]